MFQRGYNLNRREFVKVLGAGAGTIFLGGLVSSCASLLDSSRTTAKNNGSILLPPGIMSLENTDVFNTLKTDIQNLNTYRQCQNTGTCSANFTQQDFENMLIKINQGAALLGQAGVLTQIETFIKQKQLKKKVINSVFADATFKANAQELGFSQADLNVIKKDLRRNLKEITEAINKLGIEQIVNQTVQGLRNRYTTSSLSQETQVELWFKSGFWTCTATAVLSAWTIHGIWSTPAAATGPWGWLAWGAVFAGTAAAGYLTYDACR